MGKYRVWARSIDYCYLDVETNSAEEAFRIASKADGGDFIPDNGFGTWEMDPEEVQELKGENE